MTTDKKAIQKAGVIEYSSYTLEAAEHDAAEADAVSGSDWDSLDIGENVRRFLPPRKGQRSPFRNTRRHFIRDLPGIEHPLVFHCPRVELKRPCIACDQAERLIKSPSAEDRKVAQRIAGGLRVMAGVVNRHIPDPTVALRVYEFGKSVQRQLKAIRRSERTGGDFTDPTESGFDIIINREGTGQMDTCYTVIPARDRSPLHEDLEIARWLIENQPDLEKRINPIVPDELLSLWGRTSAQVPRKSGRAAAQQPQYDDNLDPLPVASRVLETSIGAPEDEDIPF